MFKYYDRMIDLHLHLDGSLSLSSVKELADMQNIELPGDEKLSEMLTVSADCRDLNEYLTKFDFPLTLLQTEKAIEKSVFNLMSELSEHGLIYAEVRFAPQLHMKQGLTQDGVVKAAVKGLKASKIRGNLILCCMRGENNREKNIETVKITKKYLGNGVCAADLAGAEALFPTGSFCDIFKLAKDLDVPMTIHAGEADGAQSIYAALDGGAARIGHGVRSVEDAALVKILAENRVPLELCPTSNMNTCIFDDIGKYPLRELIKNGVKVTINTDNMTVSGTTIHKEYKLLADTFDLTDEEVKNLLLNSAEASFADEDTKTWLRETING